MQSWLSWNSLCRPLWLQHVSTSWVLASLFWILFFMWVLGIEPRSLCLKGKHSWLSLIQWLACESVGAGSDSQPFLYSILSELLFSSKVGDNAFLRELWQLIKQHVTCVRCLAYYMHFWRYIFHRDLLTALISRASYSQVGKAETSWHKGSLPISPSALLTLK